VVPAGALVVDAAVVVAGAFVVVVDAAVVEVAGAGDVAAAVVVGAAASSSDAHAATARRAPASAIEPTRAVDVRRTRGRDENVLIRVIIADLNLAGIRDPPQTLWFETLARGTIRHVPATTSPTSPIATTTAAVTRRRWSPSPRRRQPASAPSTTLDSRSAAT
jgi:hypothetical protein